MVLQETEYMVYMVWEWMAVGKVDLGALKNTV